MVLLSIIRQIDWFIIICICTPPSSNKGFPKCRNSTRSTKSDTDCRCSIAVADRKWEVYWMSRKGLQGSMWSREETERTAFVSSQCPCWLSIMNFQGHSQCKIFILAFSSCTLIHKSDKILCLSTCFCLKRRQQHCDNGRSIWAGTKQFCTSSDAFSFAYFCLSKPLLHFAELCGFPRRCDLRSQWYSFEDTIWSTGA